MTSSTVSTPKLPKAVVLLTEPGQTVTCETCGLTQPLDAEHFYNAQRKTGLPNAFWGQPCKSCQRSYRKGVTADVKAGKRTRVLRPRGDSRVQYIPGGPRGDTPYIPPKPKPAKSASKATPKPKQAPASSFAIADLAALNAPKAPPAPAKRSRNRKG